MSEQSPEEAGGTQSVVIGVGSNIDPEANVQRAFDELAATWELSAASPLYRSSPVGRTDQADFINAAVRIRTDQSAEAIKERLRTIETTLGRVRDPADPCGPRTIDLDLLAIGEATGTSPVLPDPDVLRRWFVAVPFADVWPDWRHPVTGEAIASIADRLRESTSEAIEPIRPT